MVNGVSGSNQSSGADSATSGAASSKEWAGDLDRMAFLRLLVAQLKNQNPMDPVDDKEFLAQMAQFRSVEQMENLGSQMAKVAAGQVESQAELVKIHSTLDSILQQLRAMAVPVAGASNQAGV